MLSDRRNLNRMRVTAAFVEQVVANRRRYIGTPLMVDKLRLESGQYSRLTHLQDERTGTFFSQQIGSFIEFETLTEEDGETVLVGTARVEKRFERACTAIQELYEMGKLCVSFEITASVYEQREDELIIDAADGNSLIGMCIVSIPAYADARALALVASMMTPTDENLITERKIEMAEENKNPAAKQEEEKPEDQAEKEGQEKKNEGKPSAPKKTTAEMDHPENSEMTRLQQEVNALKEVNEQLALFKQKWEAAEAARLQAEEQERRHCLSELLVTVGLKAEEHQEAVEKLEYAALIPVILKALREKQAEKPAVLPVTASANGLVQPDGIQMSGNKSDHPYHKLVKNLTL